MVQKLLMNSLRGLIKLLVSAGAVFTFPGHQDSMSPCLSQHWQSLGFWLLLTGCVLWDVHLSMCEEVSCEFDLHFPEDM